MLTYLMSSIGSTWVLLGGVFTLFVLWAWTKTRIKHQGLNIPPFPAPAKPFLGHMLLLKGDLVEVCARFRQKAGDLYSLNTAGQHLIVVNGYENIREVLVKNAEFASDRPVDLSSQFVKEDNHGLFTSRGPNWKEQRLTTLAILRDFGMGKNILAEKAETEAMIFMEKLSEFQGKPVEDLLTVTNKAVGNVVCSVIVGDRFDYDDPYYMRMMQNVSSFVTKSPKFWIFYAATVLKLVPGDFFGIKEWKAGLDDLNENFCQYQINKMKQEFDPRDEPTNLISAYLLAMHQKKERGTSTYLDEPNLISIIKSLFLAGTETTSTTITWCVLFCLHHPDVQDKVFQEIRTHVGTSRAPRASDITKLRYLSAVIRESQRLGGVAHFLPRVVSENFEVKGYLIPKDSQLLLNLNSALHDEDNWENANQFRPERFLDADGQLLKFNEFLPYGLGRRVCPGEAMAKMELDVFLSSMFQRFRFEPEDPAAELPSLKGLAQLTFRPAPYKVRFVERV